MHFKPFQVSIYYAHIEIRAPFTESSIIRIFHQECCNLRGNPDLRVAFQGQGIRMPQANFYCPNGFILSISVLNHVLRGLVLWSYEKYV